MFWKLISAHMPLDELTHSHCFLFNVTHAQAPSHSSKVWIKNHVLMNFSMILFTFFRRTRVSIASVANWKCLTSWKVISFAWIQPSYSNELSRILYVYLDVDNVDIHNSQWTENYTRTHKIHSIQFGWLYVFFWICKISAIKSHFEWNIIFVIIHLRMKFVEGDRFWYNFDMRSKYLCTFE